jgi:hypothetical protein
MDQIRCSTSSSTPFCYVDQNNNTVPTFSRFWVMVLTDTVIRNLFLTQLKLGVVKAATNSKPVLSRVGGIAGFHGNIAAKTGETAILSVGLDQHLITRDWDKIKHLPGIRIFSIATVYIKLAGVTGCRQVPKPAFTCNGRARIISCDTPWNKVRGSFRYYTRVQDVSCHSYYPEQL